MILHVDGMLVLMKLQDNKNEVLSGEIMAILESIKQTKIEEKPIKFQCDVCKSVFELTDEYDIKYHSHLEHQMAIIRYDIPSQYGYTEIEKHCCSTECVATAIKQVPFNAKITIPVGGFYKK